jgi:hypothetical protein
MDYATKPNLDTKKPVGNGITAPQYKTGVSNIIATKSADMTNASTDLNGTYDQTNLSAKFKNPRVKQDVPSAGQNQYM